MEYALKASVIIPTYNRNKKIRKTLESIKRQTVDLNDIEIIICHIGSINGCYDIANEFTSELNIRYFYEEGEKITGARIKNKCVFNARGEICIFVKAGIILDRDFILNHIKAHNKEKSVVIGSLYENESNKDVMEKLLDILEGNRLEDKLKYLSTMGFIEEREDFYKKFGEDLSNWSSPWIAFSTCNVSVERTFLLEAGGFDESYTKMGYDEVDLGIGLFSKGGKFKLLKEAIAMDIHEKTKSSLIRKVDLEEKKYMYRKYKLEPLFLWQKEEIFNINYIMKDIVAANS